MYFGNFHLFLKAKIANLVNCCQFWTLFAKFGHFIINPTKMVFVQIFDSQNSIKKSKFDEKLAILALKLSQI